MNLVLKPVIIISFLLCLASWTKAQSPSIKDLDWLTGRWTAIKNKPGKLRTERWEYLGSGRMEGYGTVKQGTDTTFHETMQIEDRDGILYFIAEVPENKTPVLFKITKTSPDGFDCENPLHDFPKKIIYRKISDTLNVNISGNGNSVDFVFRKEP